LELNGSKITERMDMERALEDLRPGETVSLIVERDGQKTKRMQTYKIQLGEEPVGAEIPAGLL